MGAAHYIEELLYRYNCVVVPGFGAFLTQHRSAVLNENTNTFDPPSKAISFNQQLVANDGLLTSYMAHATDRSYEQMLQALEEEVSRWREILREAGSLQVGNIGELRQNEEGNLRFRPEGKINFLTASYGLSPVVAPKVTRETLKEEVVQLEEKIPFIITPEARKTSRFRPYLKYAAVLLMAFAAGVSGYRFYQDQNDQQQLARQRAQQMVQQTIQEATFFDLAPLQLPAVELEINKLPKAAPTHHVIAGAFRYRSNANKKVRQLQARGFADAAYLGTNDFGLHQVTYGSFTDPEEALEFLKKVKTEVSRDAWLLSKK